MKAWLALFFFQDITDFLRVFFTRLNHGKSKG